MIDQTPPTLTKMAEMIRTLQEKLEVVETKQDEFQQEGPQIGDDDDLTKQVKDIKAVLTRSYGDIVLDFEGLQLFLDAQLPVGFKMKNIEKF